MVETKVNLSTKGFFESMREFISKVRDRIPDKRIDSTKFDINKFREIGQQELGAVWFGHSTTLIKIDNKIVLTDPIFADRASPLSFIGPKNFDGSRKNTSEDLPDIDAIIISHDHYDHLDYKTIKELDQRTKKIITSLGVGSHLEKWGILKEKIEELDWWESTKIDENVKITATPSRHFSGRWLADRNKTFWSSWVIEGSKKKVFFSGDTGYFDEFKTIGEKFGPFDITLLECGAYSKYWPDIHMQPSQTIQLHKDVKGKLLLPIHWSKFDLSLHNWIEPIEKLLEEAKKHKTLVTTPKIGQIIKINDNENVSQTNWWKSYLKYQN